MAELYANISIGHENDWTVLEKRIIHAAQCQVMLLLYQKQRQKLQFLKKKKKYVSINSKWGHLPYLEVAKKSEIDEFNAQKLNKLTEEIGIPNMEYYRCGIRKLGIRKYRLF